MTSPNKQGTSGIVILAVTRRGAGLATWLAEDLGADALLPAKFSAAHQLCYSGSVLDEIQRCWSRYHALVLIMASGVAIRALAPLLSDKASDPAVVCLDEAGRWAIPLLGGHQAGANELARRIAALTGGQAPITTASDVQGKPALDLLGREDGWRIDVASALTQASACLVNDESIGVWVDPELPGPQPIINVMLQVDGATLVDALDMLHADTYAAGLIVGHRALGPQHAALGRKCVVYRPPVLVVGMGCRRGVPLDELRAALETALHDAGLALESVGALATVDLKGDEPGLRALADELGVPLQIVASDDLADLDPARFSPSAAQVKLGLPGVAEPCALLVAGGPLLVPKRAFIRCTIAVALADDRRPTTDDRRSSRHETRGTRHETREQNDVISDPRPPVSRSPVSRLSVSQRVAGRLSLIGIGPGDLRQMTGAAAEALRAAEVVVGYKSYVEQIRPLLAASQEIIASPIGDEVARAEQAIALAAAGQHIALISSGDIGIYAMAGPVFEALRRRGWQGGDPEIVVLPGVSAMQAVAARLGAPLSHDFCAISLSNLLTPWATIERRLW
ncbi:MAG: cobalamin biosynthesis protein, partial [Roseiflexaceae bacterium]